MGEMDVRQLLRQLRDEQDPDPLAERLMEMYREWWWEADIETQPIPTSDRGSSYLSLRIIDLLGRIAASGNASIRYRQQQ